MSQLHMPPDAKIAHARLKVSDLGRSLSFYRDLLGLREAARQDQTAALSATGEAPYHLILDELPGALPFQRFAPGLFHVAIRYPSRSTLAEAVLRLITHGWPLQGASDHGVSEAIYLADPDGLGLELYTDRPREQWPKAEDQVDMFTKPLDFDGLLQTANRDPKEDFQVDPRTDIGHMHLQVSNLEKTEEFYANQVGLDVMQRLADSALFLAAGGYHHHLGANVWNSRGAKSADDASVGLGSYALEIPEERAWLTLRQRLAGRAEVNYKAYPYGLSAVVGDPDDILVEMLLPEEKMGEETLAELGRLRSSDGSVI